MRVEANEARGLVEVTVEGDYTEEGIAQVYEVYDRLSRSHDAFGEVDVVTGEGGGFRFRTVLQGAQGSRGAVKLKRFAIVTDTSRRVQSAARFLSLFGIECRTYMPQEIEQARVWAAEASSRKSPDAA